MTTIVHDFWTQLNYSNVLSDEPAWVDFYRRIWPEALAVVRVDGANPMQRHGVDRLVILPSGQQFTIDEKKRKKDYGDFLLEEWSVFRDDGANKPGWTMDAVKVCDFIAYAIPPAGRAWLLPFEILRMTAVRCLPKWKQRAQEPRITPNLGYQTINWPVPWDDLFTEMRHTMSRRFGSDAPLPLPHGDKRQIEFLWAK